MITVAVDAMGGDNAPEAIVKGCLMALDGMDDLRLSLHGPSDVLSALVPQSALGRIEIVHAPDVITNHDQPTAAVRHKPESSLVSALTALKEGKAQAFVSAGSTGAVLAGGIFRVGRLKGVARPALAPVLPTAKGSPVQFIDIGANIDCKPHYLEQFAQMGSAYMNGVFGVQRPRVGLLNIGVEPEKGNELALAAYSLLKESSVNFVGNAEAREAVSGDFDVIVSDGFSGNVLLKSVEGTAIMMSALLKEQLSSSIRAKLGALIVMPALKAFKKRLDYTEYGGAALLGIDGVIIKAHGSSNARAFCSALGQAVNASRKNVPGLIAQRISAAVK